MRSPGRSDRLVFLGLAFPALLYVIARAALVPAIHDEPVAYYKFVLTGDFMPFVAEWGAGNHVLYSALSQVSHALFGPCLFALRFWSVLAFGIYAWYGWCWGAMIRSRCVRWCAWAGLIGTPFLMEFFSLARGYGLACAWWMMTLFHLVRFVHHARRKDLVLGLVGNTLAIWTIVSLIIAGGAVVLIAGITLFRDSRITAKGRSWVIWSLLGLLPLAVAALFAHGLQEHGAFYAGTVEGFVNGTLPALFWSVLHLDRTWLVTLMALLMAGPVLVAVLLRINHHPDHLPLLVLVAVVLIDASVQMGLHLFLGYSGPMDRAALYLLPLLILMFASAVDQLAVRYGRIRFTAAALLVFPVRMIDGVNVDHTSTWPEQAIPDSFFELVADRQAGLERPLLVGGEQFLAYATWSFGAGPGGDWLNELDPTGFPQPLCDLIMIDPARDKPPEGFQVIAQAPGGRNALLERKVPLDVRLRLDSLFDIPLSRDEFRLLWQVKSASWTEKNLLLDFSTRINSKRGTTDAQVLAGVNGPSGEQLFQVEFNIDHQRGSSFDGPYRIGVRLPRIDPGADHITFCVYDPRRRNFALEDVHLRVWEIGE